MDNAAIWTSLITSGVLGLGALIVWLVHKLAQPWFKARTDANKTKNIQENELIKEKLAREERLSLNGFNSNEKMIERLMGNTEKFYDSLLKTSEQVPMHLNRIYDRLELMSNRVELSAQKMDVINETMKVISKKLDVQDAMIMKHERDTQTMGEKMEPLFALSLADHVITKRTETSSTISSYQQTD